MVSRLPVRQTPMRAEAFDKRVAQGSAGMRLGTVSPQLTKEKGWAVVRGRHATVDGELRCAALRESQDKLCTQ